MHTSLPLATGVHLCLATEKCELIVRGVYGGGKTRFNSARQFRHKAMKPLTLMHLTPITTKLSGGPSSSWPPQAFTSPSSHRPLCKAVDYAELFTCVKAQQEASVSDVTIVGALPRECLLLRLGDPKQTSGGTAAGKLAQEVRAVSDQLPLRIRAPRRPWLPQDFPQALCHSLLC